MSPIIIDALTPCLKTVLDFRGGNICFIAVLFSTRFWSVLATFVNGANPIENNARKFATVATYHLQCTGVCRHFSQKKEKKTISF